MMVGISCKRVIKENGEKIKWKKKIKIGITLIDYFVIFLHIISFIYFLFTWILNNLIYIYILILNIFDFENYFSINYYFSLNNFLIIKYNLNDFPHESYSRKSLKIPKMTFPFLSKGLLIFLLLSSKFWKRRNNELEKFILISNFYSLVGPFYLLIKNNNINKKLFSYKSKFGLIKTLVDALHVL